MIGRLEAERDRLQQEVELLIEQHTYSEYVCPPDDWECGEFVKELGDNGTCIHAAKCWHRWLDWKITGKKEVDDG